MAQDESRSISENVTWSVRKRVQEGKVSLAYSTFLGYDKGDDGKLKVNEEQAETIKIIFRLYMIGYSAYHIKEKLEAMNLKTPFGKTKWHVTTIQNILCNEKYKGDALLQKTYTVDFLTKKTKKNEGELPQVYVENAHDAIIDKKAFDLVQIETERRKGIKHYSGISIFSGKIYCGECGAFFGRKVWHSNERYKKIIYRCNNKYKNKKCESKAVTEDEIKDVFVKEFNKLNRAEAIRNAISLKEKICDIRKLEKEKFELNKEKDILIEKNNNLILQNSKKAMNQKLYKKKENAIMVPYNKVEKELSYIESKIKEKSDRCIILDDYIKNLKSATKITDFDEGLFCALVENVIVSKNDIKIRWKGEIEP